MAKVKFKVNFKLFIPITAGIIIFLILILFSNKFLLSQTIHKSTANFSVQGSKLVIDFDIADIDQDSAIKLSKTLGVNTNWTGGIELELDKQSLEWIEDKNPEKVYLDFSDDSISFNSSPVYALNNVLPEERINFSTGSARLNLVRKRNGDFNLKLKDPQDLIFYATSSGKLTISEKMQILFPILNKIDTIDITLQEKSVKGRISLLD